MAQWYEGGHDVLVTPTLMTPPPVIGFFKPTVENPLDAGIRAAGYAAFTSPFNMTGQPGISLPLHWTAGGLPVGVQFVAPLGREDVLIRLAAELEQARPWAERRPPVSG
jgi:amidase